MNPRLSVLAVGVIALVVPTTAAAQYRPDHIMLGDAPAGPHMHAAPDLAQTTAAERRRARGFLRRARAIAKRRFPSLQAARARGYRKGADMSFLGWDEREPGTRSPFVHFYKDRYVDDGRILDPRRPESLVYWRNPTGSPVLVGYMFRASSLRRPPDRHRLGKLVLWHGHARCDRTREPGNAYQFRTADCPRGLAHYGSTVMTHLYLTRGLRTAYAVRVPTRALRVFVPGGGPHADVGAGTQGGHDHRDGGTGGGHDHSHAAGPTPRLIAAANAWTLSVVAPAVAAALLLVRRRRLRSVPARLIGIGCLAGVAVTHASDLPAHASGTPYLAVLFCGLIVTACALALALATASRSTPVWALAGTVAALTMVAYLVSRTIGLPGLRDHVGHWDTAGIASLMFESLLVTLSLGVMAARASSMRRSIATAS